MSDTIPAGQLRPGDVLLYRGTGFLANAIRFFDGTEVSHAGLYIAPNTVGEALGDGLERRDLKTSFGDNEWVMSRRLKPPVLDLAPVTQRGETFLKEGHRYAYEQILLLAFLGLTRKLAITPVLRVLLRSVLDRAAEVLEKAMAAGKQPMICSEFVYRSYDEALPDREDAYTLHINMGEHAMKSMRGGHALAGAAAGARPKGRGVHPESVLAWAVAPSTHASMAAMKAMAPRRAAAPRRRVSDKELESQIETYLVEATHGGRARARVKGAVKAWAAAAPAIEGEDLLAAVERFAIAHHHASRRLTKKAEQFAPLKGERVSATLAAPMQTLSKAASDFVTPGDLLHCDGLMTMGRIQR